MNDSMNTGMNMGMNTAQRQWLTLGIAAACVGFEIALVAMSPQALAKVSAGEQQDTPQQAATTSEALSWYEAQQRRYQQRQAPELSHEQEHKMLTMMKLMTLEL